MDRNTGKQFELARGRKENKIKRHHSEYARGVAECLGQAALESGSFLFSSLQN